MERAERDRERFRVVERERESERFLPEKDGWRRQIEAEKDDCIRGRAFSIQFFIEGDVNGLFVKK